MFLEGMADIRFQGCFTYFLFFYELEVTREEFTFKTLQLFSNPIFKKPITFLALSVV